MAQIAAVLLDLDDTLLINDQETFGRAYFAALARHMAPLCAPGPFASAMNLGTQAMMANDGAKGTNRDAFMAAFFAEMPGDRAAFEAAFEEFYVREFPRLRTYTQQDLAAPRLVRLLRERGYDIAIATQPLLPRTATMERLRWAGLEPELFDPDLVACFETMAGCKPQPGFFAEMCRRLGRAPNECLMVGDSPSSDLPARRVGLKTFWVDRGRERLGDDLPDARGSLEDLIALVETGGIHDL